MPSQQQIRQQITDQIVEALRAGGIPPWRRGWVTHPNAGLPRNVVSGRRYSGINVLLLQLAAARHDFRSRCWGTFRQWEALGGRVMRRPDRVPPGRWGCQIVFFSPVTKTEVDRDTGHESEVRCPVLRAYTVFSIDQVEGSHLDHLRAGESSAVIDFVDFGPAERAIEATGADIRHGGDRAFYRKSTDDGGDFIGLPHKHQFEAVKEYYATALHELAHWTEVRLGWTGPYALGELRAEIAASFLLAELCVPQSDDMTNHHAYLAHWLRELRDDPRCIFTASAAASRAVDFVLGYSRPASADEPEQEVALAG